MYFDMQGKYTNMQYNYVKLTCKKNLKTIPIRIIKKIPTTLNIAHKWLSAMLDATYLCRHATYNLLTCNLIMPVDMREKYVDMQLNHANMQLIYVNMQLIYD